ncbi:hypothetical protein BS47DRAFT_1393553 [Hydnum rufescens UP504]|uniref:Uncharacterized protein n=1 Tax=Hydnum rufescens UP504 TaxID=1448309 RepID=A0A9P6AWY0_9AGAM|nr:hypothetical protein BS47DRAFT_1393553 [Hydnum rufescens UP504]
MRGASHRTPLPGLPLIFHSFFVRHSRAGGFFVFCLYNFMALGFLYQGDGHALDANVYDYFLVPLIIFNIAVCCLQITLEPRISKHDYGFPQATRTIVFITKSHVGLNAVILIAWIALSCCTIPHFSFIMRRRDMATAAREAASSSGTATQNHDNHTAHFTPLDEKHPGHDYDPPAPKYRGYEIFDVERQH